MGGRLDFDFTFGGRAAGGRRPSGDGTPFRLLLIGDFSGRAAARARGERAPLRKPLWVDAGDIDRAVATLAPSLRFPAPAGASGTEPAVTFEAIDDLHADALFRRLARFQAPRAVRQALAAPAPSPDALAAAEAWLKDQVRAAATPAPAAPSAPAGANEPNESNESTESTIDRLLGRAPSAAPVAAPGNASDVVGSLLQQAVQAHVTADVGARRKLLLSTMDEVLGAELRAVLSSPDLRALEGAWRGAERVIRALDTDQDLKIALFDACKQDLADAVDPAAGGFERSELHKLIVDADRGWAVVAVDFTFGLALPDLRLLATLGATASRAGAALLADAAPALVGCPSLAGLSDPTTWEPLPDNDGAAPFWQALRASPIAPSIALALPRVLARLPYGKKTDPLSELPFEELPARAGARPEHRIWGSGAFALAQLCGQAFREDSWQLDPGAQLDLPDLPSHTYDADGETELVACTEAPVGERAAAAARARGVVPLLAHRDRAAIRVAGASSIAAPAAALAGAWAGAGADTDDE